MKYDFRCLKCGEIVEKYVVNTMPAGEKLLNDTPCPKCGKADYEKVFTPAAVKFMNPQTPGRRD